jgi:hypothetical protein
MLRLRMVPGILLIALPVGGFGLAAMLLVPILVARSNPPLNPPVAPSMSKDAAVAQPAAIERVPTPQAPSPPAQVALAVPQPPVAAAPSACLNVQWSDGTPQLQQLATQDEAALAGVSLLLTGTDLYAAKVRLTNTGEVPIRVFPENIRLHHDSESLTVMTIDHPAFLNRCVLAPGESVQGLIGYRAAVEVGAAMRLGDGTLSYSDSSLLVTYR